MRTIQDRLDNWPEPWQPKAAGEKLIGELVDRNTRTSDYGDPYEVLTVAQEDGVEKSWHAFHTMARNEVERKNPQLGEQIGIVYGGLGEPAQPGMNAPERWRLIVDRKPAPPTSEAAVIDADRGRDEDPNDPGPDEAAAEGADDGFPF